MGYWDIYGYVDLTCVNTITCLIMGVVSCDTIVCLVIAMFSRA